MRAAAMLGARPVVWKLFLANPPKSAQLKKRPLKGVA